MITTRIIIILTLFVLLSSCSSTDKKEEFDQLYGSSAPLNRFVTLEELKAKSIISYSKDVQPILNQRCAVCHSCFDAPCQLNLTSIDGLDRGASSLPVYNGARVLTQYPTRLGIDAQNTKQ